MTYPHPEQMNIHKFDAERILVSAQTMLSEFRGLEDSVDVQEFRNHAFEGLVMQMKAWFMAGRIPSNEQSTTIEYPDGVWQMFKWKHMPYWFCQKFPVRMVKQTITTCTNHYFVCPHLKTDRQDRHVQFMATGLAFSNQMSKGLMDYGR